MASQDLTFDVNNTVAVQRFHRNVLGFVPGNLFLTVEDVSIRFWYGGITPTPASGHLLAPGSNITFRKTAEIENLKIIATTGTARIFATVGGT